MTTRPMTGPELEAYRREHAASLAAAIGICRTATTVGVKPATVIMQEQVEVREKMREAEMNASVTAFEAAIWDAGDTGVVQLSIKDARLLRGYMMRLANKVKALENRNQTRF